jgi:hypothetical protein
MQNPMRKKIQQQCQTYIGLTVLPISPKEPTGFLPMLLCIRGKIIIKFFRQYYILDVSE